MTAELPEGFHDPVTKARLSRLQSEVNRLAHSSPAVVGRDTKIRELKAAISILFEYQCGFASAKSILSGWGATLRGTVIVCLFIFPLRFVLSGKVPTISFVIQVGAYLMMAIVVAGAWDLLKTRRRLRMAEALADSLVGPLPPSSPKK